MESSDGGIKITYTVTRSTSEGTKILVTPTANPGKTAQPSSIAPRMYDFTACIEPCNGSNSLTTFPANTKTINISWSYENIPSGAHYVRKWTHETKGLWMTYDCSWDRSSTGKVSTKFYDNYGLAAGTWTITMEVNGKIVLQKKLSIKGSVDTWLPLPPISRCF